MDIAVCNHFAGFITNILVFLKARSLRLLTSQTNLSGSAPCFPAAQTWQESSIFTLEELSSYAPIMPSGQGVGVWLIGGQYVP